VPHLLEFFKGSARRLGVFYPNHYLVAVFRDPSVAARAASAVIDSGFDSSEVAWADGKEVIELDTKETGIVGSPMQAVWRFFSTEQLFADHDREHARNGAGFLVMHCGADPLKDAAWKIIEAESPLDARYYSRGGIEHLAGDLFTD